ncbi:hypothetical protein D3C75_620960 [compost metagenome]
MRHLAVDVDDGGIGQHGREEVFLLALHRGAVPLQGHFRQHLAGSQGVVHQRHGLVQGHGELERLVDTLTGGLAGLRIGRHGNDVLELLDQHLVFVTLHEDVADGVGGEGTGGDVALGFTFDADITWSWHEFAPDGLNGNDTQPKPLAVTMPIHYLAIKQQLEPILCPVEHQHTATPCA